MYAGILARQQRRRHGAAIPSSLTPVLNKQTFVANTDLVYLDHWHQSGEAYLRFQNLIVFDASVTPSVTLNFTKRAIGVGFGGLMTLNSSVYHLLVDGERVGVTNGARFGTNNSSSSFVLNLTDIDEGWHYFGVECEAPEQGAPFFYMYVKKTPGAVPAFTHVPVCTGSWEVVKEEHDAPSHYYGMIPISGTPTPRPLVPRDCPVFSTALARANLFRENIVPVTVDYNIHRKTTTRDGLVSTYNTQRYFFSDLVQKYPPFALLDGPRGVGTMQMPTHIFVDRHGGTYACDPWRVVRVSKEGWVTTRCGYKHSITNPSKLMAPPAVSNGLPAYYGGGASIGNEPARLVNLELVGDWSAIQASGGVLGFHETWGMAFDITSLATDEAAAPIFNPTNGELEKPHLVDPRLFVTDTQNNRILLLTFSKDSFTSEPVVTEFLTGLSDPWDCVWVSGVLYVTERTADKITAWDAATGAFIRTVVQGQSGLATLRSDRRIIQVATLTEIQAQPIVLPDGLFYQADAAGRRWLYYSSRAMAQIKRIDLDNDEIQHVCRPYVDGNSHFFKFALSDGTFGPRGTVFASTWSANSYGMPEAFLPDTPGPAGNNAPTDTTTYTNSAKWAYHTFGRGLGRGKGGAWDTLSYGTAVGIGSGRLLCGSSQEGLVQISQALAGDPTYNATLCYEGNREYHAKGYHLIHGDAGYGHHGFALPWNESAAIDHYLTVNGHIKP